MSIIISTIDGSNEETDNIVEVLETEEPTHEGPMIYPDLRLVTVYEAIQTEEMQYSPLHRCRTRL